MTREMCVFRKEMQIIEHKGKSKPSEKSFIHINLDGIQYHMRHSIINRMYMINKNHCFSWVLCNSVSGHKTKSILVNQAKI